jgi:hypothetical protein
MKMIDWERLLEEDVFEIAGRRFKSRLIIGSGKFKSFQENKEVLEASGAEMITVAVRRVNITDPNRENLLDYIDPKKYLILPNTAGCYSAEEAIKTAMLAREATGINWIKLEVIGDQKTLLPDMEETLKARNQSAHSRSDRKPLDRRQRRSGLRSFEATLCGRAVLKRASPKHLGFFGPSAEEKPLPLGASCSHARRCCASSSRQAREGYAEACAPARATASSG